MDPQSIRNVIYNTTISNNAILNTDNNSAFYNPENYSNTIFGLELLFDFFLTITFYMLIPILLKYAFQIDFSEKTAKKTALINSICVFIIFTIIHLVLEDTRIANATLPFLYYFINYNILKPKNNIIENSNENIETANFVEEYKENPSNAWETYLNKHFNSKGTQTNLQNNRKSENTKTNSISDEILSLINNSALTSAQKEKLLDNVQKYNLSIADVKDLITELQNKNSSKHFCIKCGQEINDEWNYCFNCGNKLK